MYSVREMRRTFSIFLILFFGLGPLAATLHADDDSSLPACCRRHGAHHCAMSGPAAMLAQSDGKPILTAPSTCPYFPGYTVASSPAPLALAALPISLPALLAQPHSPITARAAARLSQLRTRAGRGPPATSQS
ncbi:MAG: hypothetical protein ABR976_09085 [Terracidiphilus sp.]